MHRRSLLKAMAALPAAGLGSLSSPVRAQPKPELMRVWPGGKGWPSETEWQELARSVEGRLTKLHSSLDVCRTAPAGPACRELFRELKNPYFIGDDPSLTQTTGWLDAWETQTSAYVVAAQSTADVVAAVNFAREKKLRLVVRGGAHSYLGTSNAYHSLMIWTRHMADIVLHDAFVPSGCADKAPEPAASIGPGAIWMHTYDAVTTRGGRYVQGGGCGTVGVAGLVQGGGFGSYSKNFGTAAGNLLEAEVVTADGAVRIANACTNSDLFWALKGGGGGTFGVVTRLTLRTHALPPFFGFASVVIDARSDDSFRKLVRRFLDFYAERLVNPNWGEIANVRPHRRLDIQMSFQGLTAEEAQALWQPFLQWVSAAPQEFDVVKAPAIRAVPARHRWDPQFLKRNAPGAIRSDDRPGASDANIFWAANLSEAGHFIEDFQSLWLPAALLSEPQRDRLTTALLAAAQHSTVELHFQKGLFGGSEQAIRDARDTATNPAMIDAFALAIVASEAPPAYAGMSGHLPDLERGRRNAAAVRAAFACLFAEVKPRGACYVAESEYFLLDWQDAYWGPNYPRLRAVKQKYDPDSVFFVRHGVGSEGWSDDGFSRFKD
ncbi:MAG: FAD-binding oxidoreductase [Alphaproteobacteria bacterium]|nr:FAD-binding oxidoreductase [Alphaproteobacteria bacterium]